ncbi:hypothetical protein DNTS_026621, partial [Danionella cerebrum]
SYYVTLLNFSPGSRATDAPLILRGHSFPSTHDRSVFTLLWISLIKPSGLQMKPEKRYMETATVLEKESSFNLTRFEVCDNVDLETVLMEYQSYYYIKFQKYPKLTKKLLEQ